jgi:coproporphyrinogen III oxidase-like Fe-S oxidoreductase
MGLGPSAHSSLRGRRSWNVREWAAYERLIDQGAPVGAAGEDLDAGQMRLEELYLGLRTSDGLAGDQIPESARKEWVASGWAETGNGRLHLTAEGWLRLDALVGSIA